MQNPIIEKLYEGLNILEPDWIPEEYESGIKSYTSAFSGKNQLPIKNSDGKYMYPINRELIFNRISNQLLNALIEEVEVPETEAGVEDLLTKNPKFSIMLNRGEERLLCSAVQKCEEIEDEDERDFVRDLVTDVAITFLSPRIKSIYRRFEKAVGACGAYEDVMQEMVFATIKMLKDFNFDRTTAGITKDFMNLRMYRAINIAISANRSASMAQETWNKVNEFVNTPADHSLTRDEIRQKYHCSPGLVDIMFTFIENGGLEVSLDYTPEDKSGKGDTRQVCFGDMIAAKDYSKEELEVNMILQDKLTPLQYEIVMLKLQGYTHEKIAEFKNFPSKRTSQYQYLLARNIIIKEFNVDVSQYSKGRAMHRKKPDDSDS